MITALIKIAATNAKKTIINTKEGVQIHVKVPKGILLIKVRTCVYAKTTFSIVTRKDRKSTRLNSSHVLRSRMPSSA